MSELQASHHTPPGRAAAAAPARSRMALDRFLTFGAVVVLFGVFSITAKNFFTMRNVLSLLLQTSTTTLMGIGVTFTIITAGAIKG
jgi:ribose/xylose/arabinose/galactoside ABC-type transport system permease subunit